MRATTLSTPLQASPDEAGVTAAAHHERAEDLLLQALACNDDREAEYLRDEAVLLTLDLPEQVARRYRGRGIDHDDLVQVGRLGLVKAALGYRAGVGSSFVSYAMPTISGEVKRHFRDCGWAVRPPRRLQEVRALLGADEEQLTQSLRRSPTTDEIADALGLDPREVSLAKQCGSAYSTLSLDLPDERGGSRADAVADESAEIEQMLRLSSLRSVLALLTDRERLIVRLRFVEEQTQSEIGTALGVSQMQVSRLLTSILARLRLGLGESAVAA
jgi:RNA polymerase sigma-B factor